MRRILKRGMVVGTVAGTVLLASTTAAMAAPSTQSPEGIGLVATGNVVTVAPTPDATSVNPNPSNVASVTVAGILNASTLSAQVSGNTTTAGVQSLDTSGIIGALIGTLSANAITSSCTANSTGTFTETANVTNLSIAGATFNGTPAPNTVLGTTLPALLSALTVTLNEQVAGPVVGSQTVNAVHIHLVTLGLVSEDIYIASSTCGPYNSNVPMASGKGLAVGLGAMGVIGLGYGVLNRQRRRTHARA